MLKKGEQFEKVTNKRVHWDSLTVENEGKTRAKRQKTEHAKREEKSFDPQLIEKIKATIKKHLENGTYSELEGILNKFSTTTRIKILSVDDYELFRSAALGNDIKALNFIISAVPQNVALNMVSYRNFAAFTFFLIHTNTLEKLGKLDHKNRIKGFKIFLKIDHESVQKAFNDFEAKLAKTRPLEDSVRKDFNTALTQLKEKGVIQSDELGITEKHFSYSEQSLPKNNLLNHFGAHTSSNKDKTNLTFHSTTNHTAFNSMSIEEDVSIRSSRDISNLTETAEKAQIFTKPQTQVIKPFNRELL
jgi:hypothetical protein